jgi:hypothetical protein
MVGNTTKRANEVRPGSCLSITHRTNGTHFNVLDRQRLNERATDATSKPFPMR